MRWLLLLPFFLLGCTGLEKSERERLLEVNRHEEVVYRNHDERFLSFAKPEKIERAPYAWEERRGSIYPRITKEYFRCRGSKDNPPIRASKTREVYYIDCGGADQHSLPVRGEEEFIYPRLIELLNFVQETAGKKVEITCGHRCPDHNKYVEPTRSSSLHMIGAEVDFYVDGLSCEEVIATLQKALKDPLRRSGNTWSNEEVSIHLYQKGEGRDLDNNHDKPYIALTLRKHEGQRIQYSWNRAARGYLRW